MAQPEPALSQSEQVLAFLRAAPGSTSAEVGAALPSCRKNVSPILSKLVQRGDLEKGSEYPAHYYPKGQRPMPVMTPAVPSIKEQVQQKAQRVERVTHEANLPRDLPPLPLKSKPVTPDDIDAVRKALTERKSASVALLASRINRTATHTESVLEFMADQVIHEGNQWRLT